jgi:hypothetical protein
MADATDPGDQLVAFAATYVQFAADQPALFELTFAAGLDKARFPALAEAGQALFTELSAPAHACAAMTIRRAGWYWRSLLRPRPRGIPHRGGTQRPAGPARRGQTGGRHSGVSADRDVCRLTNWPWVRAAQDHLLPRALAAGRSATGPHRHAARALPEHRWRGGPAERSGGLPSTAIGSQQSLVRISAAQRAPAPGVAASSRNTYGYDMTGGEG